MNSEMFSQKPFRCKLEWGAIGAERAAERGDVIVIVDVLSFSTAVTHAVAQGAIVYPCPEGEGVAETALTLKAELAVSRHSVPSQGRYSLSPLTYDNVPPGTKVLLPSLNGGTCSRCAKSSKHIIVGTLINAEAVADCVATLMEGSNDSVTVVACGEREKAADSSSQDDLRMAIEDYLGAKAILSGLAFSKSPEAQVCEAAFTANRDRIDDLLWESVSGRELRQMGFDADVSFASRQNATRCVPVLTAGAFREFK